MCCRHQQTYCSTNRLTMNVMHWMGLRGWSHDFLQQIQNGVRRPYWISQNANISVYWMKIFAQNLVERCNTTTRMWPKTESEVNSRDVITLTVGNNCKMAFNLHVVDSVNDENNFYTASQKKTPTLASRSFNKHELILTINTKQHQYTFKNDMHIQLSLSLHFYLLYLPFR